MPIGIIKIKGADGTVHSVPALKGDASMWYTGTAVTGTGTGIAATVTGSKQYDMYLNTTTKRVYQATNANVWDYKFTNVSHYDARFVIGNTSAGYTADQCDYLCDGTDDQVEINAAIAALPATGGKIVLLDGAYNITADITMNKANVELCGTNATQLIFANAASIVRIYITANNCSVHNLQLTGSQVNESKGIVCAASCKYLQFYNLQMYKGALYLSSCTTVLITKNIIGANAGNSSGYNCGVYIENGCSNITVSDNDLTGSYKCVYAKDSLYLNITNNTSTLFNDDGVYLDNVKHAVVSNNNFYTAVGGSICGITCMNCTLILMDSNYINLDETKDVFSCIYLSGSNRCTITNNILRDISTNAVLAFDNNASSYINFTNNIALSGAALCSTSVPTNFVNHNNTIWPV